MKRSLTTATALAFLATPVMAQEPPFGGDEDRAYAETLWQTMNEARLVGEDRIMAFPYPGTDPHGMMLETFYTDATVDGHTGTLVVKRNYGPEGVTVDQVLADTETHLAAITIMFRREQGYDEETGNWFWAKYLPDGTLDTNPDGRELAGLVGKGADSGCIACHSGAGEDMMFTTDAFAMPDR